MNIIRTLFKLIIGHAVADFVLQQKAMSIGKCRRSKQDNKLARKWPPYMWFYWLTAHSLVNAGVVWLITDSMLFAFVELILHWIIDHLKCEKLTNLHTDQLLHLTCKIMYAVLL